MAKNKLPSVSFSSRATGQVVSLEVRESELGSGYTVIVATLMTDDHTRAARFYFSKKELWKLAQFFTKAWELAE